jgi:DNA-binding NarL/FixJ family response regulator
MVNPISSNNPTVNKIAAADQVRSEPTAKLEATPAKADVVQLSNAAQAKLLKQQGFDVAQIAIKLGLDVKTVSTYLPSVSTKA